MRNVEQLCHLTCQTTSCYGPEPLFLTHHDVTEEPRLKGVQEIGAPRNKREEGEAGSGKLREVGNGGDRSDQGDKQLI